MKRDFSMIVITGGPGAGKTAVLEMAKRGSDCHFAILPESAGIVFGGGFWRLGSRSGVSAAQRAIYHVQRELETMIADEGLWSGAICDRGTLDGLAYWPGTEASYFKAVGSSHAKELARYAAVIHLRTPSLENGYNHQNRLRIESAEEAAKIDARIARIWRRHPSYFSIESSGDFNFKAARALELIAAQIDRLKRGSKRA